LINLALLSSRHHHRTSPKVIGSYRLALLQPNDFAWSRTYRRLPW
jgi:hypothetical protein